MSKPAGYATSLAGSRTGSSRTGTLVTSCFWTGGLRAGRLGTDGTRVVVLTTVAPQTEQVSPPSLLASQTAHCQRVLMACPGLCRAPGACPGAAGRASARRRGMALPGSLSAAPDP